jgi:ABC-type Zn2+ transport system substrate-binding protein/surface adhesin
MVMKVLPLLLNSLHAVITSPLVVVTLLSWFGKAIWMKMNKSLSKILELNQLQMIMQEECQLLVRKDQRLQQRDKEQQEAQRQEEMGLHKNQLMAKLQELVEI